MLIFVVLGAIILNLLLYFVFSKTLEKISNNEMKANKKWNIWLYDILHNSKEFLVNSGWINILKITRRNYSLISNENIKKQKVQIISSFLADLIVQALIILIYLYSNYKVSLGDVLVSISLASIIFPMIQIMLEMLKYYKLLVPSIDNVINAKNKYSNVKKNYITRLEKTNQDYYIKNLSFSFQNKVIFDKMDIRFENKGIVILSAPNGTGKSTLAKILFGLLPVETGETNIFSEDIEYLSQNSVLFPGDIYFNITLKEKSQLLKNELELFEKYASLTGIDEMVKLRENNVIKMDDEIFSGGEKRAINLAGFYYLGIKKKILILDEPDTGLDYRKKIQLKDQLRVLSKEKLLILITHDPVFNDLGKNYIIERGAIKNV